MSASRLDRATLNNFAANLLVPILQTIGRGMRKGMPVRVYFVDAAWAPRSKLALPESDRSSLLVTMRAILRACLNHPAPDLRTVYQALYGPFRNAFDDIDGLLLPDTPSENVGAAEARAPLSGQTALATRQSSVQPRQQPYQLWQADEWEEMEDLDDNLVDDADGLIGAGEEEGIDQGYGGFEPTLETTALDFDLPSEAVDADVDGAFARATDGARAHSPGAVRRDDA
jgi:hypothetical protein